MIFGNSSNIDILSLSSHSHVIGFVQDLMNFSSFLNTAYCTLEEAKPARSNRSRLLYINPMVGFY